MALGYYHICFYTLESTIYLLHYIVTLLSKIEGVIPLIILKECCSGIEQPCRHWTPFGLWLSSITMDTSIHFSILYLYHPVIYSLCTQLGDCCYYTSFGKTEAEESGLVTNFHVQYWWDWPSCHWPSIKIQNVIHLAPCIYMSSITCYFSECNIWPLERWVVWCFPILMDCFSRWEWPCCSCLSNGMCLEPTPLLIKADSTCSILATIQCTPKCTIVWFGVLTHCQVWRRQTCVAQLPSTTLWNMVLPCHLGCLHTLSSISFPLYCNALFLLSYIILSFLQMESLAMLIIFKDILARGLWPGCIQPHHHHQVQVGASKGRQAAWPHSVTVCIIVIILFHVCSFPLSITISPLYHLTIVPRWVAKQPIWHSLWFSSMREAGSVSWAVYQPIYKFIVNYVTTIMNSEAQLLSKYSEAFPMMFNSGPAAILRTTREPIKAWQAFCQSMSWQGIPWSLDGGKTLINLS